MQNNKVIIEFVNVEKLPRTPEIIVEKVKNKFRLFQLFYRLIG